MKWRPFQADVFTQAERDGKLIFLVIGAAWCPYSQRFLSRLHADAAALAELNGEYVPILVDGDERPEAPLRYQAGGWPGILILEPGGEVLWGSSHVPENQLARLLVKVRCYHSTNRRDVRSKAEAARREQRAALQAPAQKDAAPIPSSLLSDVAVATLTAFDPDHGGFALGAGYSGTKFPNFEAIEFLLALGGQADGSPDAAAEQALRALMERGLWDTTNGGLRRYAAERDWSGVHGSVLLLDNARLLRLLCLAGHQLNSDTLRDHARTVLAWCRRAFHSQGPSFLASTRPVHPEVPDDWPVGPADASVYVGPQAAMASALLAASWVLDDAAAADEATALLDLLWEEGRGDEGLARRRLGASRAAPLHDQADFVRALVDAYETLADPRFLGHAETLFEATTKQFKLTDGAFFDVVEDRDAPGRCRYRARQPEHSAAMALCSLRLHALTRTDWYRETALEALAEFSRSASKQGLLACRYAHAVLRYREPVPVAIVVGDRRNPAADQLHSAVLRMPLAARSVHMLDPLEDLDMLKRFEVPQSREVRAYLCAGSEVLGPWRTPDELRDRETLPRAS